MLALLKSLLQEDQLVHGPIHIKQYMYKQIKLCTLFIINLHNVPLGAYAGHRQYHNLKVELSEILKLQS